MVLKACDRTILGQATRWIISVNFHKLDFASTLRKGFEDFDQFALR